MNPTPPQNEPLLIPLADVPRLLSFSRSHLYTIIASGRFGPAILRAGRKRLIRADELHHWVAAGMPPADEWAAMQASAARRLRIG
jgi:excisionase family DNA binding protein